ncbi:MAG TPA: hypothetical protein VHY30_03120 [Verrucomicrobiae bacterium]|nr:hypothetical protein [Verrucomicrobiae bacterium]
MSAQLFESFSGMIDKIPAKGVLMAIELERQMIKTDLAEKRTLPFAAVHSILSFCSFLKNATSGLHTISSALPIQHIAFYRKTVARLIETGELPFEATTLFDETFSPAFLKNLAS